VHGSALGAKEVDATRLNLGWAHEPFHVPEEVKRSAIPYKLFITFSQFSQHFHR